MSEGYKMKPRYKKEDINIKSVRPNYKFPRSLILKIRRGIIKIYRLVPENFRDKIEDFGKNGFSNNFRNMVIADWFAHAFFINKEKNEEIPSGPFPEQGSFRERIRHHGGPHHDVPPFDGVPHHRDIER